jgi:hypothetical protein
MTKLASVEVAGMADFTADIVVDSGNGRIVFVTEEYFSPFTPSLHVHSTSNLSGTLTLLCVRAFFFTSFLVFLYSFCRTSPLPH